MKQPATDLNAVTIVPAKEQRLSLRIDEQLHGEAREYLRAGLQSSANSQRAFTTDIRQYADWCEQNGYEPTPLSAVAHVTFLGRTRPFFTVQRHLASLAKLHRQHGLPSPTTDKQFKVFMKGFKLKKTVRQKQAPDFSVKQLRQAIDSLPPTPTCLRNRAILLLGFTGAFRHSALASLDVTNLLIDETGLVIRLDRSKTNQFGEVEEKAVACASEPECCPIGALQQWLSVINSEQGPLFVRIRKRGASYPRASNQRQIIAKYSFKNS